MTANKFTVFFRQTFSKDNVKEFFRSRRVGFWLLVAAVALSLAETIAYAVLYSAAERAAYASSTAMWLPYLGIVVACVMSLFAATRSYAPLALFGFQIGSFIAYMNGITAYMSLFFFRDVNAKHLSDMDGAVWFVFVAFLLVLAASGTAAYLKQCKADVIEKQEKVKKPKAVDYQTMLKSFTETYDAKLQACDEKIADLEQRLATIERSRKK